MTLHRLQIVHGAVCTFAGAQVRRTLSGQQDGGGLGFSKTSCIISSLTLLREIGIAKKGLPAAAASVSAADNS